MEVNSYICIRCNKSFNNNKSHLKRHFLRKKICKLVNINNDYSYEILLDKLNSNNYLEFYKTKINNYKCNYCNKYYKHKSSMINHRKNCINNPKNIKIEEKDSNLKVINNIQNQYNTHNHNQNINIININPFGKEDLKNIDYEKLNLLSKEDFYNSSFETKTENHKYNILSILEDIMNTPENNNYSLINKREKKYMIKTEEDSKLKDLDYINSHLYDLVNSSYKDFVEDIYHYKRFLKLIDVELGLYKNGSKDFETKLYYQFIIKLKKCVKKAILFSSEEQKLQNSDL